MLEAARADPPGRPRGELHERVMADAHRPAHARDHVARVERRMAVDEGQELVDLPLAHSGPQAGVQGRSAPTRLQGDEAPAAVRRLSVGRMPLAPPGRPVAPERAAEEVASQRAQQVGYAARERSLGPRRHREGLDRLARLELKGHRRQVAAPTSERRPHPARAERPRRLAENALESRRALPAVAQRGTSVTSVATDSMRRRGGAV